MRIQVRRVGVRHSKIQDMAGKRVPLRGQPSDTACLQGQPQALGWLRGAALQDEPWEGDRPPLRPPGRDLPAGLPRSLAASPALCSHLIHFVLPHLESLCREGRGAPTGHPDKPDRVC